MYPPFTPYFDWIAEKKELSMLEKLIICKVLRYGVKGCFEGNENMARRMGVDRRNLIRTIKNLVIKQWLIIHLEGPRGRQKRYLWVNPEKLTAGPLFNLTTSGTTPLPKGQITTRPVASRHPNRDVSYNRVENLKNCTAELMREENKMSVSAKEKRKQELLSQLENME